MEFGKLLAVIQRQGVPQGERDFPEGFGNCLGCHLRSLIGKLSRYQIAALAFDVGGDVLRAFRAFYGIAFPVAKPLPCGNQFGPLINADTPGIKPRPAP